MRQKRQLWAVACCTLGPVTTHEHDSGLLGVWPSRKLSGLPHAAARQSARRRRFRSLPAAPPATRPPAPRSWSRPPQEPAGGTLEQRGTRRPIEGRGGPGGPNRPGTGIPTLLATPVRRPGNRREAPDQPQPARSPSGRPSNTTKKCSCPSPHMPSHVSLRFGEIALERPPMKAAGGGPAA